jgi:predicted nucleic acid-binding protein
MTVSDVVLLDTSAAVALVISGHEGHRRTLDHLAGHSLGMAGHAWFETFSVLTRLPPPARRRPEDVTRILQHNFPHSRFLTPQDTGDLIDALPGLEVAGGAIYDALVGYAAAMAGHTLVSRDRRALPVYRRLNVDVELIA